MIQRDFIVIFGGVVAILLFAALQVGYVIGLGHKDEAPRNYDPLGYLRQAQLFQNYGVIKGLDTSFRETNATYLKDTARQIDPNPSNWSFQIAPPAHHFEPRTDAIINQYPPGTGFFLHLYREGVQLRSSLFVALSLAFLSVSFFLWLSDSPLKLVSVVLVGVPLVVNIFRETFSYSVHLSLIFSVIIGVLGTLFFFKRGRSQIAIAALMALLIGVSTSIRLSNILFFLGYIPILWAVLRAPDRAIGLLAIVLACILGLLPLAASQAINTGSVFQTTYAHHDKVAFVLDPLIAFKDLGAYFGGIKRHQLTNWLAVFAICGAIAFGHYRRQPFFPILPTSLNLLIGVCFFTFHSIVLPWYLMSHAVAALSGAATYLWFGDLQKVELRQRCFPCSVFSLIIVSLALLLSAYFFAVNKPSFDRTELAHKLRDTDIVYACETSGLFIQSGIYSACIFNGNFEIAQEILLRVSSDGRRQFIALENPVAKALFDFVCPGTDKDVFLTVVGFSLFMIPPNLNSANPNCK